MDPYTSVVFKGTLNLNFQARGKIVLFNYSFKTKNYDKEGYLASKYLIRVAGVEAERYGAVGVLVRTATDLSLYSPHLAYIEASGIPSASLAVEDAELIDRISKEGKNRFFLILKSV